MKKVLLFALAILVVNAVELKAMKPSERKKQEDVAFDKELKQLKTKIEADYVSAVDKIFTKAFSMQYSDEAVSFLARELSFLNDELKKLTQQDHKPLYDHLYAELKPAEFR